MLNMSRRSRTSCAAAPPSCWNTILRSAIAVRAFTLKRGRLPRLTAFHSVGKIPATLENQNNNRELGEENDNVYSITGLGCAESLRGYALEPARHRRHLHGDDRQPAIRLDVLRAGNPEGVRLGPGCDPGRLHAVRP